MKNRIEDQGTRNKEQGSRGEVQGSRGEVRGSRGEVQGTRDEVQGSRFKVQGVNLAPFPLPLVPRSSKGFTLIELIVTITIIVFLMGMLLTRIWFYQEQAEKAAMEQVAGALQSALIIQYAHLLTRGREAEVKNLISENPLRWLMKKPPNYAGEYYGVTPAAIAPGNWAYDLKTRELIYVPDHSEYFVPGRDGLKWVRYRASLQYERVQDKGNKGAEELTGVLFEPVERYQWLMRGEK
jgi:prepilin-type N-terminal cleavage/methylation domain-containing protein